MKSGARNGRQLTLDTVAKHIARDDDELTLAEPLLQPEDAARLLAVKLSWVYDRVRDGDLPWLRVGRHIRFTRAMLEAWLVARRAG